MYKIPKSMSQQFQMTTCDGTIGSLDMVADMNVMCLVSNLFKGSSFKVPLSIWWFIGQVECAAVTGNTLQYTYLKGQWQVEIVMYCTSKTCHFQRFKVLPTMNLTKRLILHGGVNILRCYWVQFYQKLWLSWVDNLWYPHPNCCTDSDRCATWTPTS